MKKFLAIILAISFLLTGTIIPSFAQQDENPVSQKQTLFISDLLRKVNTPFTDKIADRLDNISLDSERISYFLKEKKKKSIILSLLVGGFTFFDAIISRALGFNNALWVYESLKDKCQDGIHWFDWLHPVKSLSVDESISRLNKSIDELIGQNNAKKDIKKIVYGIAHKKNQANFNKEEYSHGDVIYILGPSGVGKTFVSLRIAEALSNHEPFIISASEVDLQDKDSIISQLFSFSTYNYGYGASSRENKRLVKYLHEHKGGVVIINEYDKMWSPALDEILRTVADQGIVNVKGQVIDCRGTTFIITSNECTQAINSGNQDLIIDSDKIDDGTGSRTNNVKHDKSFLNRVKKVVFDNLTQKDYENIVKGEYLDEKFINYWKSFANVDLDLEDAYKHIAKKAVLENIGSRILDSVKDNLNKELVEFIDKHPNKTLIPVKLYVYYDENKDEFILDTEKRTDIQLENEQIEPNEAENKDLNVPPLAENSCELSIDEKDNIEDPFQKEKPSGNIPDGFSF